MSPTCLFTAVLCLQTVAIVERQVFDFLGHMWTSIVANFLQIIFIMVGFFGACQHRPLILASYLVFSVVWIGWNVFIICFYLEVGILDRDSSVLNMGTGSKSWWYGHGITCRSNETYYDSTGQSSMVYVGCLLQYYYVEVIHAGVQCLLSTVGLLASSCTLYVFREDCDSEFKSVSLQLNMAVVIGKNLMHVVNLLDAPKEYSRIFGTLVSISILILSKLSCSIIIAKM